VTKTAIQTHVADVMLVAERWGLGDRGINRWRLGGEVSPHQDAGNQDNQNHTRAEFQHENLMGSKDLRHFG
jgi:hypothetical protein